MFTFAGHLNVAYNSRTGICSVFENGLLSAVSTSRCSMSNVHFYFNKSLSLLKICCWKFEQQAFEFFVAHLQWGRGRGRRECALRVLAKCLCSIHSRYNIDVNRRVRLRAAQPGLACPISDWTSIPKTTAKVRRVTLGSNIHLSSLWCMWWP